MKFRAPEFFFRGSEFLFRGSYGKIPVQKRFRGGLGTVFSSRWNFFPDTFPVSLCRRNPPGGFPAGRISAPGVSRVPSKRQVWRGFRDILISESRVWLRFFRAVPARRPNTRISEGENEQIVNAHPNVHFVNIGGAAGMPPPTNSYRAQYKSPLNFYCPLFSLKKKRFSYSAGAESHKLYLYLQPEAFLRTKTDKHKSLHNQMK